MPTLQRLGSSAQGRQYLARLALSYHLAGHLDLPLLATLQIAGQGLLRLITDLTAHGQCPPVTIERQVCQAGRFFDRQPTVVDLRAPYQIDQATPAERIHPCCLALCSEPEQAWQGAGTDLQGLAIGMRLAGVATLALLHHGLNGGTGRG